ncbi:hypothetical protein [Bradyrhizobium sp. 142]|nr:hypothetical protein [Bradyrhizobium sp. 142]
MKLQALHGLAAELTPMQLVVFATERLNVESDYGGPALPAERARSREP